MWYSSTVVRGIIAGTSLVALTQFVVAADWPQWRGPGRDAITTLDPAPTQWPKTLISVWSQEVGEGHSSPVVVGEQVYQFARVDDHEVLRAFELDSGRALWSADYPAPYKVNPAAKVHGPGPKSTPIVAEGRVFTLGISGILSCFDAQTGELHWRKEFSQEFAQTSPTYGTAMSPLVEQGMLIAHVGGHDGGALRAFDVNTGAVKWSWNGDGPGYASPIIVRVNGADQVVTQSQSAIIGVAAATGTLLWRIPFKTAYEQNAVTPAVFGDLVILSGLNKGTFAIRLSQEKDEWKTTEVWRNDLIPMYLNSPIVQGDRLYGMTHRRSGQVFCADARTGKVIWQNEGRTAKNAAFVGTGDAVLMLTTDGDLHVIKHDTDSLQVVAKYHVSDSSTWAHPAVSGGKVIIKDAARLTCWTPGSE